MWGLGREAQGMTGIHPNTRANARKLRHEMTPQERRLWAKLRELNRMLGCHFRRQAPIGPFIADFADLGRRLVIEVDGGGHGGQRDVRRDEWLASQDFQVLRFWNNDVDGNNEGVMQVVLDAVEAAIVPDAPPPQPSPTRGEGGARPDKGGSAERSVTSPPPGGEGLGVGGAGPKGATL
jgi:very-short-patch-repair endonuclease